MKGILDFIKNKKFGKTVDYETKLNKLLDKAKKAKPGRARFEVKAECKALKFTSVGKKSTPVNELDICKITNLKKTSFSEKAIAFTYPGPDGKHPLMLYAMRFEKEADYKCFIERIDNSACEVCEESRSHSESCRGSPCSSCHSSRHFPRREKKQRVNCYTSSDNILSPYKGVCHGGNCCNAVYQMPSPYRRAYSLGPQNVRIHKIYRIERGSGVGSCCSSSCSSLSSSCGDFAWSSSEARCENEYNGGKNAYCNSCNPYY